MGLKLRKLPSYQDEFREEKERRQKEKDAEARGAKFPDICDYVPHLSPRFSAPKHLEPMLCKLRHFKEQPFRVVFSVPPRHGKSETLLHFIPWALRQHPELRIGYVTYSMGLARKMAIKVQALCRAAGVRMATKKVTDWTTPEGGGFLATGIGGMLTGVGLDILIVDDPTKDRVTAESQVYRDRIWEWFTSTATTRLMPGASVVVCGTRWHEDDLQGRLIRGHDGSPKWEYVNLPAVADDAEEAKRLGRELDSALWPEMWTKRLLEERKAQVGPYDWASLFQGRPQPKGGLVFKGDTAFWHELPKGGYRIAVGMDLACSDDTKRDHSVAVVGWYVPDQDRIYVVDVIRIQKEAPEVKAVFSSRLSHLADGSVSWRFYAAGTERAAAQFFRVEPNGLPITVVAATASKFIRSTDYAAAWNDGKILLPSPEVMKRAQEKGEGWKWEWVNPFVSEHKSFTGAKGKETDDQVDAAVAMHDVLRPRRRADRGDPVTQFSHGARVR